jgi:zinc D-Ala-D-Ala dipeptidase
MGSPIDEMSARSLPEHFANCQDPVEQEYHHHRQLLCQIMTDMGFARHPAEWWHFSIGDQLWAWLRDRDKSAPTTVAYYGRAM